MEAANPLVQELGSRTLALAPLSSGVMLLLFFPFCLWSFTRKGTCFHSRLRELIFILCFSCGLLVNAIPVPGLFLDTNGVVPGIWDWALAMAAGLEAHFWAVAPCCDPCRSEMRLKGAEAPEACSGCRSRTQASVGRIPICSVQEWESPRKTGMWLMGSNTEESICRGWR